MEEKEFIELLRKIGNCDDKEQMQRVIDEHNESQKTVTNADRIRADMDTDEGLADYLVHWLDDWGEYETPIGHIEDYEEAISKTVEWLKQPAEKE